jgi:hypothetical protein
VPLVLVSALFIFLFLTGISFLIKKQEENGGCDAEEKSEVNTELIGRVCFEVLTLKREGDDVIDALKVTFQFFSLKRLFFPYSQARRR